MPTTRPGMKSVQSVIVSLMVSILAAFFCRAVMAGEAAQIRTDKDAYRSGETVKVQFFNASGKDSDWICIVAAGQPEDEAGDYQYMPEGVDQGTLTFTAPPPGKYEARAYYHYKRNGYAVSARHAFSVESDTPAAAPAAPAAEAGKAKPAAAPAARAPVPGDSYRISLSVFHFTPLNMEASPYGIAATNTIVNSLKREPSFVMLDRRDLETYLFANDLRQTDRTESAIQIGARLGLNFVIAGNVESRGTMIVTNCKVIGIEKKSVIFAERSVSMGESDLIVKMAKLGEAIREAILRNTP